MNQEKLIKITIRIDYHLATFLHQHSHELVQPDCRLLGHSNEHAAFSLCRAYRIELPIASFNIDIV